MVNLTDDEYEAACERGRVEFETVPHARTVRYDRDTGMVVIHLYNGCVFSVPAKDLQGLEDASEAELQAVEVIGVGSGLHWASRDADFSVAGLLTGHFGTTAHMAPRHARLRALLEEALAGHRPAA